MAYTAGFFQSKATAVFRGATTSSDAFERHHRQAQADGLPMPSMRGMETGELRNQTVDQGMAFTGYAHALQQQTAELPSTPAIGLF